MTKSLVTGVAGFIGSCLAEKLISKGHEVIGLDCFSNYYARSIKEKNISNLLNNRAFILHEADLLTADLRALLKGVEYVYHQAAQAGVRSSWGRDFESYTANNVLATQRLLDACIDSGIKKFIYASSSSVYGDSDELPLKEHSLTKPVSPYGVTKLAGEHLCYAYWKNFTLPIVVLRYFTVYGPRQRPDMAFHRFLSALLRGEDIVVFGSGEQTRDFTFITDIIEANVLSQEKKYIGEVFNVGGGSRVSINRVLELIQEITGRRVNVVYRSAEKGDVRDTLADTSKAASFLGYSPCVEIKLGLQKMWDWLRAGEIES